MEIKEYIKTTAEYYNAKNYLETKKLNEGTNK